MADKEFQALVYRVAPSVCGCPAGTVLQHIRDAAIRACERTLLWRHEQPRFTLSPGIAKYCYRKPADTDVQVVFDAILNGVPLEKLTLDDALRVYPGWVDRYSAPEDIDQHGGTPRAFTQVNTQQYVVLPLPNTQEPYALRLFYALKPNRESLCMEDWVMDELEDVIVHSALQTLLTIPGAGWTDYELAAYHAKQFSYQAAERRARANLGNHRGIMTVKFNRFD